MYLRQKDARVLAACDVFKSRRDKAKRMIDQWYENKDCTTHNDFREILARKDIDTVMISTPDHWHTKPLIEAMLAGKDVYCEKPLTLTIDEGKLIRKVQKETGRVVQVGTQQRSTFPLFVKAMAIPHKSEPYEKLGAAVELPERILTPDEAPAIESGRRRGGRRRSA